MAKVAPRCSHAAGKIERSALLLLMYCFPLLPLFGDVSPFWTRPPVVYMVTASVASILLVTVNEAPCSFRCSVGFLSWPSSSLRTPCIAPTAAVAFENWAWDASKLSRYKSPRRKSPQPVPQVLFSEFIYVAWDALKLILSFSLCLSGLWLGMP